MRKRTLLALGIWTLAIAPLSAQYTPPAPFPPTPPPSEGVAPPAQPPTLPPPAYPGPVMPNDPVVVMPAPLVLRPVYDPNAYRIWVRAELLLWWVKNAPMPINVVASDDLVNNPNGTPVGNSSGNYGVFTGGRFAIGGWLETNRNIGIEVAFFGTEQRNSNFSAGSDANGNPMLAFPFINQTPGNVGPALLPITAPGATGFSGGINVSSTLSLWGAEFNGVFCLARTQNFEFTLLAGFRYLDLQENLYIDTSSQSLADNTLTNFHDSFEARNQFYGGQIGTRLTWQSDRFSVDITGKVALGGTSESLNVQGTTVQYPGSSNVPNFYPGGFFAQPSNMGHTTATQFGIIPSVELKFSYAVTPTCRLFVGYDFLYWNQVVRPGSQVDHNINLSQSVVLGNGALTGAASPAPLLNRTDFWAQGMTLGVEFRY
jgi:Putative beta barrel porin-7 (BBP7)